MRLHPASFGFTLLLGLLASVPYSCIDMNLPAVAATAAALGARPSEAGLALSVFMLSLAVAPLIYGPASDRYGRKPMVVFGVTLFVLSSLACAFAQSLPALLTGRLFQGAGAAGTMMVYAIIRDLFDGRTARARIATVLVAVNVITVIAPTAGAALLAVGGWRLIYLTQAGIGLVLLFALLSGFAESARIDATVRFTPSAVFRSYLGVLMHPVTCGYILVSAAFAATVFAYVAGSPLFFIGSAGLGPGQYGLIFSAFSAAVMSGAFLDGRLGRWGISSSGVLTAGLALSSAASALLLVAALAGWTSPLLVASLLIAVALAFGFCMPNMMNATMQPLPEIAGAVGAVTGTVQMAAGAISGALVALLYDGRSPLSMASIMMPCSIFALVVYLLVARPAERRIAGFGQARFGEADG